MDFEKLSRELYEKATPEERARMDRRAAELAEDEARPRVTVDAVRTNCHTGEVKTAWPIVLVVRPGFGDQDWLFIDGGGVTGYESIPVTSVEDAIRQGKAWSACHGTEGRWDGLLVPVESLRAARDALALVPASLEDLLGEGPHGSGS